MSRASARVAKLYGVPMLGLPGSKHQEACDLEGVGFIPGRLPDSHIPRSFGPDPTDRIFRI